MDEELRRRVDELWQAGRAAWPGVDVSADVFAEFVGAVLAAGSSNGDGDDGDGDGDAGVADGAEMLADKLRGPDLYLAAGLAAGEPRALREFDEQVLPTANAALARLESSPDFADEVRQQVRQKLLVGTDSSPAKIHSYRGRGPLAAWVRVAAVRTGLNLLAARKKHVPASMDGASPLGDAAQDDPALDLVRRNYKAEFERALRVAARALTSRERAVMRLNFVDGLNIDRIGQIYGVHRATVARWIAGARKALLKNVKIELMDKLRLSDSEFESVQRDVRSQIEISLTGLLATISDAGEPGSSE